MEATSASRKTDVDCFHTLGKLRASGPKDIFWGEDMTSATLEMPVDTDSEVIDLAARERSIPSQSDKQSNRPKRNKQEKRDRRHIRKAWEAHGPCTQVPYEPVPVEVLREEIACCPPAVPSATIDNVVDVISPLDQLKPKSRRQIRRDRKARLIEEDKPKRTFKPKESSYSYTDSTKAAKHGKNPCCAEREELALELEKRRMQADIKFEERYGVPYDLVVAS